MYLIHNTTIANLMAILKDGELKSNKLTKNIQEGDGLYESNNFVYFSTTKELFDDHVTGYVTLYIDTQILYNRKFYISNIHTPYPQYLAEWKIKNEKYYKRSYDRYYKYINKVLCTLYNNSMSKLKNGKAFQIFQQIAIKNKCNIKKYLVGIDFIYHKPTEKILKYIDKEYDGVKINSR